MAETIVMNIDPVKLEDVDVNENPWSVDDASVFLNYCCPECEYKNQDLQVFTEHALENHVNATTLFGPENYDEKLLFDINKTEDFDLDSLDDNKDDLFEQIGITNVSDIVCKFCEFTAVSITNIIQHHKKVHEDKTPPFFKCDHCDFYHVKNKTVKKHSTIKHGKKFFAYQCQTCGKQMAIFKAYKDHLKALCKSNQKDLKLSTKHETR